jgi:cytochrome P450
MSEALPAPKARDQLRLLRQLFRDPQPVLDELRRDHGPIVGLGWGPVRMAVVGDPALLRELFATSTDSFRWGHKFNVLGFVVGPGSMIVSDGPDHKRRRAPVQAAFSRRQLNRWIPMMLERTDAVLDELEARLSPDGTVVDLYPTGREIVLGIVVRALFGDALTARADEIGARFQRPQDYLESSAVRQLPHPLPFTKRAKVRGDRQALDAIIDGEMAARRRSPPPDGEQAPDVLDSLLAAATLSDSEIRDQVITLIGAGYDTTAASMAWMLWCAALDPGTWSALRDEADEVLGGRVDDASPPDPSTLARLDLADRVMRETLRLHPAGVLSPREAAVDVTIGDHVIRKGTLILWSAHLAGRDPDTWTDPLAFDPDRFVDLTPDQQAAADQAWVPFGRGARTCIGFALAQMELTIMIARFAQRLDVTPTQDAPPRPVGMVVNRPEGGAPMRVARRVSAVTTN